MDWNTLQWDKHSGTQSSALQWDTYTGTHCSGTHDILKRNCRAALGHTYTGEKWLIFVFQTPRFPKHLHFNQGTLKTTIMSRKMMGYCFRKSQRRGGQSLPRGEGGREVVGMSWVKTVHQLGLCCSTGVTELHRFEI